LAFVISIGRVLQNVDKSSSAVDQTGIDAASEREALDAPLSPGWAAIDRMK
jgi:hypothetical protein